MNRPKIYPTRNPYKFNVTTDVLYNHMQGQMYLASACCYSLSKEKNPYPWRQVCTVYLSVKTAQQNYSICQI